MQASPLVGRLILLFCLAMGVLVAWLVCISLQWPLVGDASMFHFAAQQSLNGATPYRDFIDMNMPLVYAIHVAIVSIGGLGDLTFRIFDLGCLGLVGGLAAALVWPAGRSLGLLAALTILAAHLMNGPAAAGQRDFLLLIPALAAALCAALSAEQSARRAAFLMAVGLTAGLATLLKPTGLLLVALPLLAGGFRWRDIVILGAGLAAIGLAALLALYAFGSLVPFFTDFHEYTPYYAQLARPPAFRLMLLAGKDAIVGVGGLAVAAIWGVLRPHSPRKRIMIGLILFGVIHYWVQAKGFFYHAYPLVGALACLGAWNLARMPWGLAFFVLAMSVAVFAMRGREAAAHARTAPSLIMPAPVTRDIEAALKAHLTRGARVQMLDMSGGAFLAMARADMRQATPYAYWLFLTPGKPAWRASFIAAIRRPTPDAILLTDSTWPSNEGFKAVDDWPQLSALLACCYRLVDSRTTKAHPSPWLGTPAMTSWRLYLPRKPEILVQAGASKHLAAYNGFK